MSKAEKLRDRLAAIQKEREEFEKHKKNLENEMNIGKQNIGKIQKGLKNNLIINDPVLAENNLPVLANSSTNNMKKLKRDPNSASLTSNSAANSPIVHPGSSFNMFSSPENKEPPTPAVIIPSGPRISDWCYTGSLDSMPPIVKSREMYENVRLLGRGAFGEVNLVKNLEDNRLFAIKTMLCPKDSDLGTFMREIRFLRASRHPCIIDVHDAFITSNPRIVHIVMHYCESGTLSSVISAARKNKTNFPEAQILKWFIQLLLAINYLHANGTLHRDLKPMNIMLTEGGDLLKVADFGLAVDINSSEGETHRDEAGTPYYTAPEMIQRESYSFPADCWSFGIILFQLLTLDRPFHGNSTAELVKSILTSEPPQITSHYSEEIKTIAKGLLRKNPTERLSTIDLVTDPWLLPKVSNFPQQYRPKYLEERIRRSHIKQLEGQIEMIQLQHAQRLQLQQQQQQLLLQEKTNSEQLLDIQSVNSGSFSSQPTDNLENQLPPQLPPAQPSDGLNLHEHFQTLDILPTLLENFGGSVSTSEKVTINHRSFIIDDENIIHSLNLQQQSMLAQQQAIRESRSRSGSNDEVDNTNSTSNTTASVDNPITFTPIRQAKADINIVDGIFGNEKFISIDVKITPNDPDDQNEEENNITESGETGHRSLSTKMARPVLELHYTTEVKLPVGSDLTNHHHHHHHHHHHNPLQQILNSGTSSKKVQFIMRSPPDEEIAQLGDEEKDNNDNTNTMSGDPLEREESGIVIMKEAYQPEPGMAVVKQRSTSIINGRILNSSVEEVLTQVEGLNIDQLQMEQFLRLTDSIENVLQHGECSLHDYRTSQKITMKLPSHAEEEDLEDENNHDNNMNHNVYEVVNQQPLQVQRVTSDPEDKEGVNEKKDTTTANSSASSILRPVSGGGRIGKNLAEAIETDQFYEEKLSLEKRQQQEEQETKQKLINSEAIPLPE